MHALPRSFPASRPQSTGRAPASRRARLLVVEDNAYMSVLLDALLKARYDVVGVACGRDALAQVRGSWFDAVLMDLNLGTSFDGLEVLREMRRDRCVSDIPVVAITACAHAADRQRMLAGGFDEFLSKPFTREQLLDAVASVLPPGL